MVLISGVGNNIRSMITGRYAVDSDGDTPCALNAARAAGAFSPAPPPRRGGLLLAGCDQLSQTPVVPERPLHRRGPDRCGAALPALAVVAWRSEFAESDLSPDFKANGSTDPDDRDLSRRSPRTASPTGGSRSAAWSSGRRNFRSPISAHMPARTQITRHDCVEGWSCIGKWTGVQLASVLDQAGLKPESALHPLHLRRRAGEDARRQRPLL